MDINQAMNQAANNLDVVNCDRELWVKQRIRVAMNMALALKAESSCRADMDLVESGLDGIANGCAIEVIFTLGMTPGYVNLRKIC